MHFLVKLPVNYTLAAEQKVEREEQFQRAFRSIIQKFSDHETPFEKSTSFNVDQEISGHYLRLKTVSKQYPKEMQHAIVEAFSRVFISSDLVH